MRKLRIATRGSRLSLIQAGLVMEMIRRVEPNMEFELVIVKTTGDIVQDKPLYSIGVKGIFEKEVNLAVLEGRADLAVHSLKDLPSSISPGLVIAGYPPRDPPYDVLVVKEGLEPSLEGLPKGSRVGTSSIRRRAFLLNAREDLVVDFVRGNVDTRLRKLLSGGYDALVLAEAGLVRLMRSGENYPVAYSRLPIDQFPPAPGQGIVAAVAREDDEDLVRLLREASDEGAMAEATAERAFLVTIGGGCHVPLGGVAMAQQSGEMVFVAGLATPDGREKVIVKLRGSTSDPWSLGREAALELAKRGSSILEKLKGGRIPSPQSPSP